jgi:hypothetical protein
MPLRATSSPALWAANAVDFREPRKVPSDPALLQAITLPCGSVSVMMVLL